MTDSHQLLLINIQDKIIVRETPSENFDNGRAYHFAGSFLEPFLEAFFEPLFPANGSMLFNLFIDCCLHKVSFDERMVY